MSDIDRSIRATLRLYPRALFDVPPTPVHLFVQGAVLTAWFILVVAQAALIRSGGVRMHRRMGSVGVCVVMRPTNRNVTR